MDTPSFDLIIDDLFGVVSGSSTVLFIKTGRGGTCYGYKNKYLSLARQINKLAGCTVVVSANMIDVLAPFEKEFDWFDSAGIKCEKIIYIGISNGAYLGARYGHKVPAISNMLLINSPLMINWPQMKNGIESFGGETVVMAYGDIDPSYKYRELLKLINNPRLKCLFIEGADHNFSGHEEELGNLICNFARDCCELK